MDDFKLGKRVTIVGTIVNIFLSILKLIVGFLSGSLGLIADGFHSLSDLASDLVVFVGLSFAEKPDDKDHHFGHGKFETFAAFTVGLFLAFAALGIGRDSVKTLLDYSKGEAIGTPDLIALFAALLSIGVKEFLFRYTKRVGDKIKSSSIVANAWHHRSDAFSSIGVSLGIAGAVFLGGKWAILDPIAGVVVAVILLREAVKIAKTNISQLLETSLPNCDTEKIYQILEGIDNCFDPHNIRSRMVGKRAVISLHIRIPETFTIKEGHTIAHRAEDLLKEQFGKDSIITVHMEPLSCNR